MPSCPVCGYPKLQEPPRSPTGAGSYEICPSCGFQFGVDDDDKGITYLQWRKTWVAGGMCWESKGQRKPQGWNPGKQLESVQKKKTTPRKTAKKPDRKSTRPET